MTPGTGTVKLVLAQLDTRGRTLSTSTLSVKLRPRGAVRELRTASTRTTLNPAAATLHYTIGLNTTGLTLLADELYVQPA